MLVIWNGYILTNLLSKNILCKQHFHKYANLRRVFYPVKLILVNWLLWRIWCRFSTFQIFGKFPNSHWKKAERVWKSALGPQRWNFLQKNVARVPDEMCVEIIWKTPGWLSEIVSKSSRKPPAAFWGKCEEKSGGNSMLVYYRLFEFNFGPKRPRPPTPAWNSCDN